jgi:hypothetical protein
MRDEQKRTDMYIKNKNKNPTILKWENGPLHLKLIFFMVQIKFYKSKVKILKDP